MDNKETGKQAREGVGGQPDLFPERAGAGESKKDRVENTIQGVGTQSRGASPARSISLSCHGVERMCCHLFHSLSYVFYISPLLLISVFEKSEHNVPI